MTVQSTASDPFELQRPQLISLAYRMLGSMNEAERIVSRVWLRWQCSSPEAQRNPVSFLHSAVGNLCLEARKIDPTSYRVDPLQSNSTVSSYERVMMSSDLTETLMQALKQRPALERSVFLLHAVFGVPAEEVAARLRLEPSVVHELVSRMRKQVRGAYSLERKARSTGRPLVINNGGGPSYH
jgi:DNA-directed RNA polymerase specialized sigma24 family protein